MLTFLTFLRPSCRHNEGTKLGNETIDNRRIIPFCFEAIKKFVCHVDTSTRLWDME
jgi:hypothetical protein